MDPQHLTTFPNGDETPENGKNSSQKTSPAHDEKISLNTSQSEAARNVGPVRRGACHRMESADGSKAPTESFITPGGLKSGSKLSQKGFADCCIKEPKCVGTYEDKFKDSYKPSVPPEWGRRMNHDRFDNSTSGNPRGNPRKRFVEVLNGWLPVRNKSIQKLRQLLDKISNDEAAYDNLELTLKYGSQLCKKEKVEADPSSPWEFLSSLGSFAFDVAGGLTSISHMINTDEIQSEFQEIMNKDADATKKMYEARSRYIKEYQYTEEIIQKFGGTTLGETLEKISDTVGLTEFFQKMEKAKNNNEDIALAAVAALDSIMSRNCNREVGREVVDAIQELVDTNPACVGAAAGVGKSLYGAVDLSTKSRKSDDASGALVRAGTRAIDRKLMTQEQSDILELESKIEGGSKTTIAKRIREALDTFETEKEEMLELLREL